MAKSEDKEVYIEVLEEKLSKLMQKIVNFM